jgi:hypothetical protein
MSGDSQTATPSSDGPIGIEQEVIDYVDGQIAALKGIQRCYASILIAALGFAVTLLGIAGYVSPTIGTYGGVLAANGAILVGLYCQKQVVA